MKSKRRRGCTLSSHCTHDVQTSLCVIFGRLITVDREVRARCIAIIIRADPELVAYMQYHIDQVDPILGETYRLAKQFDQQLIDIYHEVVSQPPLCKDGK